MKELYISWSQGLPRDKRALKVIKDSSIIDGIELSNVDNQISLIHDAGLKVSSHAPGRMKNMVDPDFLSFFSPDVVELLSTTDASTIGFHLGYSAEKIYDMRSFPEIPKTSPIDSRSKVLDILDSRTKALQRLFPKKNIVLETCDYSRSNPIDWSLQSSEAHSDKSVIEERIRTFGVNSALRYVTDPDFIRDVLASKNPNTGFLFDIAHNMISADAKIFEGSFSGDIDSYFHEIYDASKGRIFQLHLNVPKFDRFSGFSDVHRPFIKGDKISEHVLDLSRFVLEKSPELSVITLEMTKRQDPMTHAKMLVDQADLLIRALDL